MSDRPSRPEMAAELRAAEARTEARIAQLGASMEARASASDHKIDLILARVDTLIGNMSEIKNDNKETIRAVWHVGIGAILAVLALVAALWIAGINVQSNMISAFQAGLGVRSLPPDMDSSRGPPVVFPPSPAPPVPPAKK